MTSKTCHFQYLGTTGWRWNITKKWNAGLIKLDINQFKARDPCLQGLDFRIRTLVHVHTGVIHPHIGACSWKAICYCIGFPYNMLNINSEFRIVSQMPLLVGGPWLQNLWQSESQKCQVSTKKSSVEVKVKLLPIERTEFLFIRTKLAAKSGYQCPCTNCSWTAPTAKSENMCQHGCLC